jgi:hypothetical protein
VDEIVWVAIGTTSGWCMGVATFDGWDGKGGECGWMEIMGGVSVVVNEMVVVWANCKLMNKLAYMFIIF